MKVVNNKSTEMVNKVLQARQPPAVIARSDSDDLSAEALAKAEAIHGSASGNMDCFAEPVIGRAFATRWLAMTLYIQAASTNKNGRDLVPAIALSEL
ncbi:hypothetical protein AOQ73_00525 [Bradyrhizobium pachyrhizi]|nr:hypothetical protein AOQ73_00525 [Bradyrhizobium pachyrhizi]